MCPSLSAALTSAPAFINIVIKGNLSKQYIEIYSIFLTRKICFKSLKLPVLRQYISAVRFSLVRLSTFAPLFNRISAIFVFPLFKVVCKKFEKNQFKNIILIIGSGGFLRYFRESETNLRPKFFL